MGAGVGGAMLRRREEEEEGVVGGCEGWKGGFEGGRPGQLMDTGASNTFRASNTADGNSDLFARVWSMFRPFARAHTVSVESVSSSPCVVVKRCL